MLPDCRVHKLTMQAAPIFKKPYSPIHCAFSGGVPSAGFISPEKPAQTGMESHRRILQPLRQVEIERVDITARSAN